MEFLKTWFILSYTAILVVSMVSSVTVYDALGKHSDLTEFHEMVNRDNVLQKQLQHWSVTVFAPTDEVIEKHGEWIWGRESKVVLYHVINLPANKSSFPFTTTTLLPGSPPLYLGLKEGPAGRVEYYANNARITRSEEYASVENSTQLLYIIDEMLLTNVFNTSLQPPTAFHLLEQPELYDIPETLSAFDSRVKHEGLEELFLREGNYTFFIPVGAGEGHSLNKQIEVDKWVIRGHIIPGNVIFTRLANTNGYPSDAYEEDIKVKLSFVNESKGRGDSYAQYAQSLVLHSAYKHKRGIVNVKILRPNIPVKNGVVHLIASPLMIADTTVWDYVKKEKEGRLSEFSELVMYAPDFRLFLQSEQEKTLFAPSNDAIRLLSRQDIFDLKINMTAIANLLKLHLVQRSISTDDVLYGRHREYISVDNRNNLYFRMVGDKGNETLAVDGGGVRALVIHSNIVAEDGMIHIIDRVLGMPYQNVLLKLQSDANLQISANLSSQDDWAKVLAAKNRRVTFFVPSDEAWAQLEKEMPKEYKRMTMGQFPYYVRKILDRHLVADREILSSELKKISHIEMEQSPFKIIHGETPSGGLTLEWQGLRARIIRSDVQAVNGVMHVIDRVLMKRRDLTRSGSSLGPRCGGVVLLLLTFAWIVVLL